MNRFDCQDFEMPAKPYENMNADMSMGMGFDMNMAMPSFGPNPCCAPMPGIVCPPVYECPQERCCHREILHEVPHIVPINTRVINHHIYRHTYQPCYTCCEENEFTNVYENNRCYF